MKLYEVNMEIERTIEEFVDFETGEIIGDPEEMRLRLDKLEMERDRILEYLAKLVLNYRAEMEVVKEEVKRLNSRKAWLSRKEEKILSIIDRECGGVKKDLGIVTVNYRKSTTLEVDDQAKAVDWLRKNGYSGLVKVVEPTVAKDKVKPLLTKFGFDVPGLRLEEHNNMSVK